MSTTSFGKPFGDFMENESTEQTVRKLMETDRGYDAKTWDRMASELSLHGLIVPEQYGGAGLGPVELGNRHGRDGTRIVLRTLPINGGAREPPLYFARGDEATKSKLLPALAAGKSIATLAFVERAGRWDAESIAMRATRDGSKLEAIGR